MMVTAVGYAECVCTQFHTTNSTAFLSFALQDVQVFNLFINSAFVLDLFFIHISQVNLFSVTPSGNASACFSK